MKKTAVDYLLEYCERENWSIPVIVEHGAKEIEKEQIEEAFINGHKDGSNFGKGETQQFFISTIYYDETYGGNK